MQTVEYIDNFNVSILPPIAKQELFDFYGYLVAKYSLRTDISEQKKVPGISTKELLKKGTVCAVGGDAVKECEDIYNE
ncbi:MAG: hypothetical protein AB1422_14755 [bacterium]